jgi:chorismate mutase/prephenate dehydratase
MLSEGEIIAYFGVEGSFTHLAATRRFRKARLVSCPTVEEAFRALAEKKVRQIVVPIENASSGMITDTVDHLIALVLRDHADGIIRECLSIRVELALLAGSSLKPITKIYSHHAPFVHARDWLKAHYPKAKQVVVASTSEAARRAKKEPGTAAIAGYQAAELYGLKVLHRNIGGDVANQTKFFVVGEPVPSRRKATHTSVIFETAHKPGSLVAVLAALSKAGLNLTRIESRPIPGRFSEYRFMIEFEGTPEGARGHRAMARVKPLTDRLAVLGSYPMIPLT